MDVDPLWFKKNMKYVSREEMGLTSGICLASRGSRVYYKENLETSEIGTSLIFSFGAPVLEPDRPGTVRWPQPLKPWFFGDCIG